MDGQITLWDLENQYNDDFETATTKDAARYILDHLGIRFLPTAVESKYKTRIKKTVIEIYFSHYMPGVNDGRKFLDIGWTDGIAGGGCPCDNWEEVLKKIREAVDRANGYCSYSHHNCNKQELWKVAKESGDDFCPRVCCRKCNTKLCGARCNGADDRN